MVGISLLVASRSSLEKKEICSLEGRPWILESCAFFPRGEGRDERARDTSN